MTKPTKAWCVFDKDGKAIAWATGPTKSGTIHSFLRYWLYAYTWVSLRKQGYTCRKVEIREVIDG